LPITKSTLDELTFSQYLSLLRERGRGHDADELKESVPLTLETTYETIADTTWGQIQEKLENKTEELKAKAVAVVVSMQPSEGDEEVYIGGALPEEEAIKIMRGQNANWASFRLRARPI
jgi:hypothetical protein